MSTIPSSELAWKLADYKASDIEPPARCVSNPDSTEGEMMTDEELEAFMKDSIATLRILHDKHSPRYPQVQEIFANDLAYLLTLGRIDDDDYTELTDPTNLHF